MERLTIPVEKLPDGRTRRQIIDGRAVRDHAMELYRRLEQYEDIGTVEEFREAMRQVMGAECIHNHGDHCEVLSDAEVKQPCVEGPCPECVTVGDVEQRLVDANELKRFAAECWPNAHILIAIDALIDNAPTVNAAPVVHGYWEGYSTNSFNGCDENKNPKWIDRKFYRCSECRKGTAIKSRYCPNCGAKMMEVRHDQK